jgi:acyl-CoA dehydrogenase
MSGILKSVATGAEVPALAHGNRSTIRQMVDEVGVVTDAARIGKDIAGPAADAVDREARFPREAMEALGASGLLGAMVPTAWGGPGATLPEASDAVAALSRHCASSGLIFAMHLIQVAYLDRHGSDAAKRVLFPRLLAGDLLLGSANSEVSLEGARRTSICALEPIEGGYRLEKQASTVSYGEYSGAILATARRSPDSPPNEQVLVVCAQPSMELTPTGTWDTLGLRGTCSRAGLLRSDVPPEFILGDFAEILARTSLPVGNVLLGSTWVGIAEAAAASAHASVRADARRNRAADAPGGAPLSALRLAELSVVLQQLREVIQGGAAEYERVKDSPDVQTLKFTARMDNLKVATSTLAQSIVLQALAICGLKGYRNDSEQSLGRNVRDVLAAPLMVNNDRSLQGNAQSLLVRKEL